MSRFDGFPPDSCPAPNLQKARIAGDLRRARESVTRSEPSPGPTSETDRSQNSALREAEGQLVDFRWSATIMSGTNMTL
jgi:hypothetical protein